MAAFAFALTSALRVASLDLCADEYLLTVAEDRQIAAVSRLAQDSAESVLWRKARHFPGYRGQLEELLPLRPDLLVAVGGVGGRSTKEIARAFGWTLLVLPYPSTPREVADNLDRLASKLGRPMPARQWRSRLGALHAPRRGVEDAAFLSNAGLSVAPDSIGGRWMRLAGFRQRAVPGGRLSLEQLAVDPPAVLLRSDYRSGQLSLGQRWLDHPLIRQSKARQIRTDGRPWTCGGPPMLDEIERLGRRR